MKNKKYNYYNKMIFKVYSYVLIIIYKHLVFFNSKLI